MGAELMLYRLSSDVTGPLRLESVPASRFRIENGRFVVPPLVDLLGHPIAVDLLGDPL